MGVVEATSVLMESRRVEALSDEHLSNGASCRRREQPESRDIRGAPGVVPLVGGDTYPLHGDVSGNQ
jgi:hypothetical protein